MKSDQKSSPSVFLLQDESKMNQERYEGATAARKLLLVFGVLCLAIGCKADTPRSRLTPEQRKEKDEALYSAVSDNDLGRVRRLVDEGADVNAIAYGSLRILHIACGRRDASIAKFLIARGADVRAKDDSGQTALYYAVFHPDVVELLIAKGADVNARDCGYTALYWAAKFGLKESVEVLISKGAKVDLMGHFDETPLHVAAKGGYEDIVRLLLAKGSKALNKGGGLGRRPLHLAAEGGHEPVVKLLLASGANAWLGDSYSATALHLAAKETKLGVLKLLLGKVKTTGSALADSIVMRDTKKAKRLLSADPKLVKATDSYKWSALHWAVAAGTTEAVKLLLDGGSEINAPDAWGGRPLELAVGRGKLSIVKLLLSRGADMKSRKGDRFTGLHRATSAGRTEIVRLLLDSGADPDIRWPYGRETSLHVATRCGHREIAALLIAKGANVNAKAYSAERTPLHVAAQRDKPEIAALLLANGADPNAKDKRGRTPWDFAKLGRSPGVAKMLRQHRK